MKQFFKDYKEYQKNMNNLSKVWYKKHWKGTVVTNIIAAIVIVGFIFRSNITEAVNTEVSKFKKIKEMRS